MRKLSRVTGAAAAALAAAVTAGGCTFSPAQRSTLAAGTGRPVASARPAPRTLSGPATRQAVPVPPASAAPVAMPAAGPAAVPAAMPVVRPHHRSQVGGGPRAATGLRPGGPAILARGARRSGGSSSSERSLNWGGYAAWGTRFRYVRATFFVPYLDCRSTPGAYSTHWAGLDGLRGGTVEQAGINANCDGRTARYRAWYEMAPLPPAYPHITVRAGDSIVASVSYHDAARTFTLRLRDTTSGQHFRRTVACPAGSTCARGTAEAISEAPLRSGRYLPLADFRSEAFSSIRVISQAGQQGGLRSAHWNTSRITTVDSSGAVLDQPTSLYRGTAFGMYWLRTGYPRAGHRPRGTPLRPA